MHDDLKNVQNIFIILTDMVNDARIIVYEE